jgi:hypothetical protein
LCWQPVLGGGFRISWGATEGLSPEEAEMLHETQVANFRAEAAAFKRKDG